MRWLIQKELTANIRYALMSLLLFFGYALMFSGKGDALFAICMAVFVYMLSFTNLAMDERYKIEQLFTTLPISRRQMVLSKYVLVWVIFAVSIVLYTLAAWGSGLAGSALIPPLTFFNAMLGLLVASAYSAVTLPLYYRFGAQPIRYIAMILFFLIFFAGTLFPEMPRLPSVDVSPTVLGWVFLAASALISLVSFKISDALFQKKDL